MEQMMSNIEEANLTNPSGMVLGNEEGTVKDILIPRLLLMQGTSEMVGSGVAAVGEIVDSVDEVVLAAKGESIEIIPFAMRKQWRIEDPEQNKKLVRHEVWNDANDELPWVFNEEMSVYDPETNTHKTETKNLVRVKCYDFFCLLLVDGAIDDFAIPYTIRFKSTSFKEGKKIASWFTRMKVMSKPGFTVTWKVSSYFEKDGSQKAWHRFTVKKGANVSEEHKALAYKWLGIVSNSQVKEHDVDEAEEKSVKETSKQESF